MAAAKRNDPKKRPIPEVERRPASSTGLPGTASAAGAAPKRSQRPPKETKAARPSKPSRPARPARPSRQDAKRAPPGRRPEPREQVEDTGPAFIGGPRNEFGTRVARRITCSRCGNVDHVPHAPKDAGRALCRSCAVQVLNTYEVGTRAKLETQPAVCSLCKKPFALPAKVELTDEILCPDCLRGFATWTGGLETPWESRQDVVVEQRVGGTLVRRRKH